MGGIHSSLIFVADLVRPEKGKKALCGAKANEDDGERIC
jgi:hypothetical protein